MKKSIIFFVGQLFTIMSFAQTFSIQGQVYNTIDEGPIPGAHVIVESIQQRYAGITNEDGKFRLTNVQNGEYNLTISFIGFQDYVEIIKVANENLELGKIRLSEGLNLPEIQITEQVLSSIQKGDTTQYNAGSFQTLKDATAEDLLEKMPTIVMQDGKIQAQGEDVNQVLVDGKRFLGDDPTAAIRNLPAEVIDQIQIFDQKSEQAQFTGFDDGETTKTINIITKSNKSNGQFGKIYAGYGYDSKYQAGINFNVFNGDQRISVIGMTNNVNQQNFATEDLLGVVGTTGTSRWGSAGMGGGRSQGGSRGKGSGSGTNISDFLVPQQLGITTTNALGVNFSDSWGSKIEISASYFFNQTNNLADQFLTQQFFNSQGDAYEEESNNQNTNTNHRFSGRMDIQLNDQNSIVWRPSITWQNNLGTESLIGLNSTNMAILGQLDNSFNANLCATSLSNNILWKHKFDKNRRTLSVNFNAGYAPKIGYGELASTYSMGTVLLDSNAINQYSTLNESSWNGSANIQYTEPIGSKSMMLFNYKIGYQQESSDKETFDPNETNSEYEVLNEALSNIFSNEYTTHQLGGGYNYSNEGLNLMARIQVESAELNNSQTFPYEDLSAQNYLSVLPVASLRYSISRTENIGFFYRSNTQFPTIGQLQNVIDNSNPIQATLGNPILTKSYQHNLFVKYSKSNTQKSSIFYALLRGNYTTDYITNSVYFSPEEYFDLDENSLQEGAILSQPVNLDGYWSLNSYITYGFPLEKLRTNLNVDFTANYSKSPGLINEELNLSHNISTGLGMTLSSNLSDRLDFTISTRGYYNSVTNSILEESNLNYFKQNSNLKFKWIFGNDIVLKTDLTHQYYEGLSGEFDQSYLLWNVSFGKNLFKNQQGEISLTVFDILKQNSNFIQNATESYFEEIQTQSLQQYLMLSFKYDIRNFKIG